MLPNSCTISSLSLSQTLIVFLSFLRISTMDINHDGLTLEDEGMTLNLDAFVQNMIILDHCLIGRVLSDKEVRLAYLKDWLRTTWRPMKGFNIIPTTWLVQFNHKNDAENLMKDGPWTYDNCNLVIERIAPGMVPKNVYLDFLNILVSVVFGLTLISFHLLLNLLMLP